MKGFLLTLSGKENTELTRKGDGLKHSGKQRWFVFFTTGGPPACRALGSPSCGPGAGALGWGQLANKSSLKSFPTASMRVTGSVGHSEGGYWGWSPLGSGDSVLPSRAISTLSELVQQALP